MITIPSCVCEGGQQLSFHYATTCGRKHAPNLDLTHAGDGVDDDDSTLGSDEGESDMNVAHRAAIDKMRRTNALFSTLARTHARERSHAFFSFLRIKDFV